MGKPFKITPGPFATAQAATSTDTSPAATQAEVTTAFDYLRTTLGKTVPNHINRAQAATARIKAMVK
jgi:hypothetical protein